MQYTYNLGFLSALNNIGVVKVANLELAAEIASGAEPSELQNIADAKLTEKDIESAAKVVQVMAQMKQMTDEAGMAPAQGQAQGQPGVGANTPTAPQTPSMY